ncbi:hypothetical protein ASE70_18975 [Sphingomonas sp. Leaf22]|nr:hypothetical protein ASE70_18975 [Sphingomonas sp. Leaf22]
MTLLTWVIFVWYNLKIEQFFKLIEMVIPEKKTISKTWYTLIILMLGSSLNIILMALFLRSFQHRKQSPQI